MSSRTTRHIRCDRCGKEDVLDGESNGSIGLYVGGDICLLCSGALRAWWTASRETG